MSTTRPDDAAVLGAFVVAASGLSLGAGLLGRRLGAPNVSLDDAFGTAGRRVMAGWMQGAVLTSVVAPLAVLVRWRDDPVVRRALAPLLGVLAVQVATETTALRRLPSWTVLLTGTSYTCFRLWQLRVAADDLADAAATSGRLTASGVVRGSRAFWTVNLGVLAANVRPLTRRSST